MEYQVISAFIDKRTGRQIGAGEDVPDGLDRETVERLVAAGCLRPLEQETPTPASTQLQGTDSAQASDLFSGGAGDSQDGEQGAIDADAAAGEAPPADAAAPAGGSAPSARRTRRPSAGSVTS